jgi:hypothetical protein
VRYTRQWENAMNAEESEVEISDTAVKMLEGGIRALVRGNKAANSLGPCDDLLAAGAASLAEIEKLIEELEVARDYLKAEGERVQRLTARYAHLTKTASASVKMISQSWQWRAPDMGAIKAVEQSETPPLSPVHAEEHQQEPKDSY